MQGIGLNTLSTQEISDLITLLNSLKGRLGEVQTELGNACSAGILGAINGALTETNYENIDFAAKTLGQAIADMEEINTKTKSNEEELVSWINGLKAAE